MKVNLYDSTREKKIIGEISKASKKEIAKEMTRLTSSSNWKFDWKSLHTKNSLLFKLTYEYEIQGLLKMAQHDEGYFEMSNLELSLENYGSNGKIDNVAGCLIAYGCLLTFKLNEGNYKGYLAFTSKGELIPHYEQNYFAELIYREKMIISPKNGKKLIKKYLNLKI